MTLNNVVPPDVLSVGVLTDEISVGRAASTAMEQELPVDVEQSVVTGPVSEMVRASSECDPDPSTSRLSRPGRAG